jgi:hypothetical protein
VTFTVDVGWTSTRPVRPDQHTSRVTVAADTGHQAELLALSMVAARPECVMPTSVVIDWPE